jgi:hypothetical protein
MSKTKLIFNEDWKVAVAGIHVVDCKKGEEVELPRLEADLAIELGLAEEVGGLPVTKKKAVTVPAPKREKKDKTVAKEAGVDAEPAKAAQDKTEQAA